MSSAGADFNCPACGSSRLRRSHRRGVRERLVSRISGVTPYRCEDCDERSFGPRGAPASSRRSRRLSLAEQMQRLETRSQVPRWMLILAALVTAAAVLAALMYAEAPERQGWQESAKPD